MNKRALNKLVTLGFVVSLGLGFVTSTQAFMLIKPEPRVQEILSHAKLLKPSVLKLALQAYDCAVKKGIEKKPILTIIDYSLPSSERRMWVIDLKNNTVPFYTLVAHGKRSGENMTTHLSNVPESKESSIGVFKTGYTYTGKHGRSLTLFGQEKGFNDHAFARHIVVHGARYVSDDFAKHFGRLGRSWGCPALSKAVVQPIINEIKNGTMLFSYYPQHKWLKNSKFLHCDVDGAVTEDAQ